MIRFISILIAVLLIGYIAFASFFFYEKKQDILCNEIQVIVKDSLDKHFVNEQDVLSLLKVAALNPINKPMSEVNTDKIETELLKNQMISQIEAYKTPSGKIKLEIKQKLPILRVIGTHGNFYIDNLGSVMPVSSRYVVHVPIATGHVEKEFAMTDLYKFALFLQKNDFWNSQIEQIYVHADHEVEITPRVGDHRIILGQLDNFEEKLNNLLLFYKQAVPKIGWDKYNTINLKYRDQIVCTKK